MKRYTALLLCFALLLSALCPMGFAAEAPSDSPAEGADSVIFLEPNKTYSLSDFAGQTDVTYVALDGSTTFTNDITGSTTIDKQLETLMGELAEQGRSYEEAKPVFVLFNQNEGAKQCISPRKTASGTKVFDWFSFDAYKVLGKTVLTFFYGPKIDENSYEWLNKLIEETDADYLYFDTLNGMSDMYVKISGALTAEDCTAINNGERNANPGIFVKWMINLCRNNMWEKSEFDNCPAGRSFNWLYKLLSKLK